MYVTYSAVTALDIKGGEQLCVPYLHQDADNVHDYRVQGSDKKAEQIAAREQSHLLWQGSLSTLHSARLKAFQR